MISKKRSSVLVRMVQVELGCLREDEPELGLGMGSSDHEIDKEHLLYCSGVLVKSSYSMGNMSICFDTSALVESIVAKPGMQCDVLDERQLKKRLSVENSKDSYFNIHKSVQESYAAMYCSKELAPNVLINMNCACGAPALRATYSLSSDASSSASRVTTHGSRLTDGRCHGINDKMDGRSHPEIFYNFIS
ncbi:hypothetical protein KGM_215729 [Danaus plexippus plexippus]|uniref:Uncharacterized protein n=1 Tax=Danaus plexippus plexippus TaxID=278856 RepID=A0A212EWE5_DANPL|nr:hypothetical protein KGM_215729 [Danaus plexippus plexippus]